MSRVARLGGGARLVGDRTGAAAPRPAVVPALHGLLGGALLLAPGRVLAGIGDPAERDIRIAARVLGARHVAQGILLRLLADRPAVALGAAADCLHCASMVAAAALSRRHRRVAMVSALLAGGLAAVELASARRR